MVRIRRSACTQYIRNQMRVRVRVYTRFSRKARARSHLSRNGHRLRARAAASALTSVVRQRGQFSSVPATRKLRMIFVGHNQLVLLRPPRAA